VGGLPVTAFFGADIGSPSITADSHVSAYSEITGPGITTQDDTILAFNGSAFEREGVTGPFGIIGPWRQFDIERFHVPAAGMYIARGQAEVFPGVTAQVAVVNGAVALREGLPAPSMFSAIVPNGIKGVAMFASGDWLARGVSDDPTEDWVVRSGNLAARRGGQIAPFNPTGELFSDNVFGDTFFAVGGNAMGDVIIGGFTNHPNTQRNEVLVLNGDRVVMREGDRVDLDADGVFDDDAFIAGFFPDSVVVTGGRANVVYALVPIRDAAGNIIGYAYVCVRSCVADFNGDGTVDFFDYDDFVNCFETGICPPGANADFNGDGSIDFFDYDDFISAFEAGCST
jgi:hypothetical protein